MASFLTRVALRHRCWCSSKERARQQKEPIPKLQLCFRPTAQHCETETEGRSTQLNPIKESKTNKTEKPPKAVGMAKLPERAELWLRQDPAMPFWPYSGLALNSRANSVR